MEGIIYGDDMKVTKLICTKLIDLTYPYEGRTMIWVKRCCHSVSSGFSCDGCGVRTLFDFVQRGLRRANGFFSQESINGTCGCGFARCRCFRRRPVLRRAQRRESQRQQSADK